MSSQHSMRARGRIAAVPLVAEIAIISRQKPAAKVVAEVVEEVVAEVLPIEKKESDEIPIGNLNVELVKDVQQGFLAEQHRAQATISKYSRTPPTLPAQRKENTLAKQNNVKLINTLKIFTSILPAWNIVVATKKVVDTGRCTIRLPNGGSKEINVTGAYKNMHAEKFRTAARKYNDLASKLRQLQIPMLTPEMVPNAIKGHQVRAPRCNAKESTTFSTIDGIDDIQPDEIMYDFHGSRRHMCRCTAGQFQSFLEQAITKGVIGIRSQATEFGKSTLFPKPPGLPFQQSPYRIVVQTAPPEKQQLLIRCCGIMSTGGQCLKLMDPQDPAVLTLLERIFAEQARPITLLVQEEPVSIEDGTKVFVEEDALLNDAFEMGSSMSSDAAPAFTDMPTYNAFLALHYRRALQHKFGMSVYTYCPDATCPAHTAGFFVDDVIRRLTEGVKEDDFITGYHTTCPYCNIHWCLNCKTDHRNQICPGPYARYIPDIDREAIEDYKLAHCEEPDGLVRDRIVLEALAQHTDATEALREHLTRAAIHAFQRQNGKEPIGIEHTRCIEEGRRKFYASNKMCPNCKKMTHKTTGCNHMECAAFSYTTKDGLPITIAGCGHHWCFRCGGHRDSRNHHTHKCPEGIEYDVDFNSASEQR